MAKRMPCEIRSVTLTNDSGKAVPGVQATCTDCGHTTESFGESDASVRRCLALMREQCPEGNDFFYVDADE